jgi:hypothetical protein
MVSPGARGPVRSSPAGIHRFFNEREESDLGGSARRHGRRLGGRRTVASAVSLFLSSFWPLTPRPSGRGCSLLKGRALGSLAL